MVALMGPPPSDLLGRSQKCEEFFESDGGWKGDQTACLVEQYPKR